MIMKKKILFTIQWYPSFRSANVLCDTNIIQSLLVTGRYEVHCLVYRLKDQKASEEMDGVVVHRFSRSWLWTKIMSSYKDTNSINYRLWHIVDRLLLRIKQFLTIPIYPIYTPFLVKRFENEAIKLHQNECFDMVISEHSGIDTLLAGYAIKRKYPKIKYLPILWDPIVGGDGAKYLPLKWRQHRLQRLERKILSFADLLVSMQSNESVIRLKERDYLHKIVFLDIPRLVNHEIIKKEPHPYYVEGFINILYGGVIGTRSVRTFMEICNNTKIPNLNLIFLVSTPSNDLRSELSIFKGRSCLRTYLPHEELLQLMIQCEFVLNIGNGNPRMVPSKIFEYMSYGKSIITTYFDENDASLTYLKDYDNCHAINLNADIWDETDRFKTFLLEKHKPVSGQMIRDRYKNCTPEKYVELINTMFE